MTTQEAIRILDPATTRAALSEIEYLAGFNGDKAKIEAVEEACYIAIAALKAQEWTPSSERMPEAYILVLGHLVRGDVSQVCLVYRNDNNDWWLNVHESAWGEVTHWRELPEGPREGKP